MTDRLDAAIRELIEALRESVRQEAQAGPRTPDRLLSIDEAAEALGIGRTLAYGLIGRGELRSVKAGRRRLVPSTAVSDYAARDVA